MNEELELKDLTARVIAAGGKAGKKVGWFILGINESEGCKRGDGHSEFEGLYFWDRRNDRGTSTWMDASRFVIRSERESYKTKVWAQNNREKANLKSRKWREENPSKMSQASRSWKKTNQYKVYSSNARYRARLRNAIDPSASKAIIESRYATEEYLNTVTGYDWHVDHTQPISRGGKEHEDNLQVVPAKWNLEKGNHHCDRWIEDSDIYRYATAVEARFEKEAIEAQGD